MKRITLIITLALAALSFGSCITVDDLRPDIFDDFNNQNISQDLCGTYYEVGCGDNYYKYLTINTDGTMEGVYVSGGEESFRRGKCYYNESKMIFYYKNGNLWLKLYGAEKSVVEWTSEYLVLGGFYASFLTKSKQVSSFYVQERDEALIGQWIHNQAETATHTMILKENGSGSLEFSSTISYSYDEIVDWFTFNYYLYIKYDGNPRYTLWRYNLSGGTLYLYYCDVLEIDNSYFYHR